MSIDTPEKRRSALDFGKVTGTGMPIPIGQITASWRGHVLNLYSGIETISIPFIGWRTRTTASSFWQKESDIAD